MARMIALYGGSFDPPGSHHEHVAQALIHYFEGSVVVIPCGNARVGKGIRTTPQQRLSLCRLAFLKHGATIDDHDLVRDTFTPLIELNERYAARPGKIAVIHIIGSDLIQGGAMGKSEIQRLWRDGPFIWEHCQYRVIERPGFPIQLEDLPPRAPVLHGVTIEGSSSAIRQAIRDRQPYEHLVSPDVAEYIHHQRLYLSPITGER